MNQRLSIYAGIAVAVIGFLYFLSGLTSIDQGETGLKIVMIGEDKGKSFPMGPGLRWIDPIANDVEVYDSRFKQYTIEDVESTTKDGQPVMVDVSLEIGLVAAQVPILHRTIGPNWYDQVVYPATRSALRAATASEESDSVYTGEGRANIQRQMNDRLHAMEARGIKISVNLRDVNFVNKDFVATLEEKARAAQRVIIETRQAEAAVQEAIKVANQAEGQKQKRIKAAEAEREELRLKGEGTRLQKENEAKGNLALYKAEAEGARLMVRAYGSGETYASVQWAKNLGPNVKYYGVPTGAPGTTSIVDLNSVLSNITSPGGTK